MATAGAKRVFLVHNDKYKKSGFKSYVYALQKYGIGPTMPGPYYVANKAEHQGKFPVVSKMIGGKTTMRQHVLMKRRGHHHHHHHGHGSGSGSDPGSGTAPGSGTDPGSGTAPGSGTTPGSGTAPAPSPPGQTSGDVDADDIQHDAEYLVPVQIGTPGQTLNLDFDTGSSDLWVWSTELPSTTTSQYASSHTIYDPSKSSTFKNASGSTWQIAYGDSSTASGTVGTDTIKIGGVTVQNQGIELANTLSAQFQQGAGDGLLGLAWPQINTVKPEPVATPVENMITQSDIAQPLFTAYLGSWRDASDPDKGQSFYTFGFIDQDVLKASNTTADAIHYTPVDNSQGFWQFSSASTTVNGTPVTQTGNTAIADTGTTLALVSDDVCKAIYAAIPGASYDDQQQGYTYPANTTVDKLPVVQVDVGGQSFTIQKEDLGFADAGNGNVFGGVQSRGDMTFDILGDTFLKGIYAIFDQGNKRFGAVQRVDPTQNISVPPS